MIVWLRTDQKGKVLHWFLFTHIDSWSQVEWKHDLDNPAELRMTLSALPTVEPNSGTFHLLPFISYMTYLQRDSGRRKMSSRKVWSRADISCRDPGKLEVLGLYFFLRETDSKIQNEGALSAWTVLLNRKKARDRRLLSFSLVLKRIIESEKWKWPRSFTLTSVFILLWGTWVSETWMRSHKISDRIKTRTKLFLHLRNSSILETSLYYYFIALLIPHFHGGKEGSGSEWRWNTNT